MKLNRRQKDAISDALEKIGLAAALAFVVGVFVEAKLAVFNAAMLALIAVTFLVISIIFKGGEND